jgi:salicylate hydroxylase
LGKSPEIAIVGAGIGGLALAIALQRQGLRPRIYERASALGEVGAGLTLWPNATKALFSLGLEKQIEAAGVEPIRQVIRHGESGRLLQIYERRGVMRERYGAPLLQLHRRDLHDILAAAVLEVDSDAVLLGKEVAGVQPSHPRPRLAFTDGSTVDADLVVGCDGIRSRVRSSLFGEEAPRFTQIVAWRGLIPMERISPELRAEPAGIHIGDGCHLAHYAIRGGSTLNFLAFAVVDGWEEEGWTIPSTIPEMMARFADFSALARNAMASVLPENLFKWGLFDRDVCRQWTQGAVTLLGDAAHPMLPFLGQGAGMVIEDAVVLSRLLAERVDISVALADYEALRRPRTEFVMLKGRDHAHYYNSHPDAADPATLEMEIDLNEFDAAGLPL